MMLRKSMFILIGVYLAAVLSRDIKPVKPMPTISNSLVNFGKMDISFYLGDKFKETLPKQDSVNPTSSYLPIQNPPIEEPCPCSNLLNLKDPFSTHPSEMLNKILMSNDLFSFNKDHISSTMCCDSHENVHEQGFFFEFSPKQSQMIANPMQSSQMLMPSLTRILENVFPKRPKTALVEAIKSPGIDLFLSPKKKIINDKNTDSILKKKADIHAVGDNEIKLEMTAINLTPPTINKPSVKKDLGTGKPEKGKLLDLDNSIVKTSTNKSISI